jgi:alcohol dehydrogenase (cytochrome c)
MWAAAATAADVTAPPKASPAFTAKELTTLPNADWITNGGDVYNQRYSPLDQINKSNVAQLKGVWRTALGSGVGPGFSAEAQPLVYDGVIYIVSGADDVFAVDAETGKFRWTYKPNINLDKTNVCCGWLSRGVGMGDGKIFVGQVDGSLQALDQKTGKPLWRTQVGDPATGYAVTGAPLYYDGMVIVGVAGGEFGVRGYVAAHNAKTGKEIWRFYTIPGPGEAGHETWPQDNDAWKYGGGPVWQTPSVDPELGLIYFGTGNPGPDLNGAIRKGDNLYSSSVVALDAHTGKYRWHYQIAHHDIWDYDAANPTVLFDAVVDGKPRKGLAEIGKSGYLYILDRTNGQPLTPVVETPVPQEVKQATAATQPIPQGDPVTVHAIDAVTEDYVGLLPNWGRTFTPFTGDTPGNYKPGTGANWWPSSYSPKSNLMYICAVDQAFGAFGGDPDAMVGPAGPGQAYYGGGGFGGRPGVNPTKRPLLVAMRVADHSAVWRRELKSPCYGSMATGGGLVFASREDGTLAALDADTGQRLWSFQTDGGVNATATTFEHKGQQYVVVLAGGSIFGGKSNDGLWLFSLNGTMEQLSEPAMRILTGPPPFAPPPAVASNRVPDLEHGAKIFRTACQACHGEHGEGGHDAGAPLPVSLTVESIMFTADAGRPGTNMRSFRGTYRAEDLHDVASYIKKVVQAGK